MAIIKRKKPKTPGQRGMTVVDYKKVLTTDTPYKPLLKKLKKKVGRSKGRISVRHRGGGQKKLYRLVDFKQDKFDIPGKIETIEYDPYRTAFISLVLYKDGERRYILTPDGVKVGDEIITSEKAEIKPGNRLPLKNIPAGTLVYNIEIKPGGGGKIARSAGSSVKLLGLEGEWALLKMPSTEIRKVKAECLASVGQVVGVSPQFLNIGKAGRSRHLGRRPVVRGSAMNPRDHPYGGGEGRAPRGIKRPKTKWGKVTGGKKTRKKKKWSDKLIVQRRKKKKKK